MVSVQPPCSVIRSSRGVDGRTDSLPWVFARPGPKYPDVQTAHRLGCQDASRSDPLQFQCLDCWTSGLPTARGPNRSGIQGARRLECRPSGRPAGLMAMWLDVWNANYQGGQRSWCPRLFNVWNPNHQAIEAPSGLPGCWAFWSSTIPVSKMLDVWNVSHLKGRPSWCPGCWTSGMSAT